AQARITVGCGNGNFCPESVVSRAQMAVFLLKSEHTADYMPPPCAKIFSDVPCPATVDFPYSDWIEQIFNEQITAGCQPPGAPLAYCPDNDVSRAQMAPLLLKTEHGTGYQPPDCNGFFGDVPCPPTPAFPYSNWIERLAAEGITSGCQNPGDPPLYCPDRSA